MTDADLLDALRDCYDPVMRRNVVEMKLVRSAAVAIDREAPGADVPGVPPRYKAHVALSAPGLDETANAQLVAQVENRLAGMPAISQVHVDLLPAAFPILNTRRP